VFCALHNQLASLGRHAQLTHCFSAVAELLVVCCLYRRDEVKTDFVFILQLLKSNVFLFLLRCIAVVFIMHLVS